MNTYSLEERTINSMLDRSVEKFGDNKFASSGDWSITYSELNNKVNSCANFLSSLGVAKGTKVALMLRNSPAFIFSWLAVSKLGGIYVPINTDYKGDILQYQLNKADVTHIILDSDYIVRLDQVSGQLSNITHVIEHERKDHPYGTSSLNENFLRIHFDELLNAKENHIKSSLHYTDPHAISFTSGTTGPSKGVLATNCHVITFALDWIKACDYNYADRLFTPLPLFHAIASWLGVLPNIIMGNEISFVEKFSASNFWSDVKHYNATHVHGIFSMIPILLKQPEDPGDKDVPAKYFYIGQRNAEFEKRFNCRIIEVYGATETGIVTYTPLEINPATGSCGKANQDSYEVSVFNEKDEEASIGEVGEIVVRPKQPFSMMSQYYQMPNESLKAFKNLWFHTGDNGRVDKDGFFYFVDRKNDSIRRRGENISSFEVERVINSSPKVLECAAVAVPSELGEDEIKVVIIPQQGNNITPDEIWNICREQMPKFWIPKFIEFRDEMPKTPNQKIQKYLLRKDDSGAEIFDIKDYKK